jgi:DNA repair exonuclease SbcCD ATPase subunit
MGWGTCYIDTQGYLNRVTINQIDDEIEEANGRVKSAFDLMTALMASSPADVKRGSDDDPLPWPQYIKEQRDYIENEIRENLAKLHNLYSAQSALKSKEAEIEYCENGHGRIKDNWDGGDKCPVCGASFIGSCKLGLVDRDY